MVVGRVIVEQRTRLVWIGVRDDKTLVNMTRICYFEKKNMFNSWARIRVLYSMYFLVIKKYQLFIFRNVF